MKTRIGTILITLCILITIGIAGYDHFNPQHFTDLKTAANTNEAFNSQLTQNRQSQLNYVFIYKPGCPDCKHIESSVIHPLYKLEKQHRLITINANNKKTLSYLHANAVTHTPTIIVKYHDYTVYQYSGRNIKKFQRILNQRNPKTNKPFKLANPKQTIVQNDFTNTHEIEPTERINSASTKTNFDN